jgi:hypothetical protein
MRFRATRKRKPSSLQTITSPMIAEIRDLGSKVSIDQDLAAAS